MQKRKRSSITLIIRAGICLVWVECACSSTVLRCLIQLLAVYMFMEENLKLILAIFCLHVKSVVEQADLESSLSGRSFLRVTCKLKNYQRKKKSFSDLKFFLFKSCRMLTLWDQHRKRRDLQVFLVSECKQPLTAEIFVLKITLVVTYNVCG